MYTETTERSSPIFQLGCATFSLLFGMAISFTMDSGGDTQIAARIIVGLIFSGMILTTMWIAYKFITFVIPKFITFVIPTILDMFSKGARDVADRHFGAIAISASWGAIWAIYTTLAGGSREWRNIIDGTSSAREDFLLGLIIPSIAAVVVYKIGETALKRHRTATRKGADVDS